MAMTDVHPRKPLGRRCYGHIPHLPQSRIGPGDHQCEPGHARIATEAVRDHCDEVFVQEKLDGANVGVARIDGQLIPLNRAGYVANTSPYAQHHAFYAWVMERSNRFLAVLRDGERLCGEWMIQACGTRYKLPHEPFVAFDLMVDATRMCYDEFCARIALGGFTAPALLHRGGALCVERALALLGEFGRHGALDPVEGAVWRVERTRQHRHGIPRRAVNFVVKYVCPDKQDGRYLPEVSGGATVMNQYLQ